MPDRIERLRKRLHQLELDAFLVSSITNIRYLFGFTGSNAIALITSGPSYFITDRRYGQQSEQEVQKAEIIISKSDLFSELRKIPGVNGFGRVGIEASHMCVQDFSCLRRTLSGPKVIASERIVERFASVKDAAEIENIQRAARICCSVYNSLLTVIKPGVTELDISAEISYRTKRAGSERDPFEPIVASGVRSALPHGISSSKKIEPGDLIIVDFGATVNGYAADFTRTLVAGEPTSQQSEMAAVVTQSLELAEQSALPGLTGMQLDAIARNHIAGTAYKDCFQHSLGHGLGLSVHELPRIGEKSKDPLQAGNVITLEPGIYLPEVGGIRIEDDFVITKSGAENLTPEPRALSIIE